MVELRRLFALMIGSKRKYIDPSKAIDILKEAFSGGGSISTNSSDSQQDVSEFQHKLLDWLEDAFRTVESVPTPPDSQQRNSDATARASNPVVKLFYGQYLSAGINKGTSFEKKDLFGQLPLQVNGFKDIHESLEAATAQGEIETLTEGDQSRACQEQWFIHLPPVLTFELSRFQFNKNLARPEKIHKQFDFPQQIYMDRYLERNRALTRQKRDEAKKLREALRDLQCRLDRFVNYGSGPKRFPIQDVLQYALEFAQSHGDGDATAPVGADRMLTTALGSPLAAAVREPATRQCGVVRADMADVDMESPRSQISIAMDSPAGSPIKPDPGVAAIDAAELPLLAQMPFKISVSAGDPSPRCISSNELHVLQTCLTRWRTEVEQDVKDLQTQITQIEERLEAMYSDAELMKCGYRLHAVLVHEGQAASGHYWAYVYSTTRNEWLKFNDVAVDVVSWDDIVKDGVGGYHNTSAYCIMYVNTDHPDLQQVTSWGDEAVPCDMTSRDTDSDSDLLLPDLQKYVEDDNDRFNAEILAWDSERRKTSRGAGGDGATAFVPGPDVRPALPPKAASLTRKTLMSQHLELFMSESKQLARMVVEWCKDNSVSAAAKQGYQHIVSAAESGAAHMLHTTLVRNDVRLRDVLVYFYLNKADDKVINRTYLEKLQLGVDVDSGGECAKMLLTAVTSELNNLAQQPTVESLCEQWHETYRYFRETVFTFINGVQAFHAERYREALPWFVEACRLTNHPVAAADSNRLPYKSIDSRVLYYYRRQCLLHVSEESVERFKSDDQIDELFAELQKIFLQCFYMLVCSSLPKDNEVVVSIRDAWCDILSVELTEPKREKLQDLLTVLLDATADSVWTAAATHQPARLLQYRELGDQLVANLDRAIDMAASHGYIEAAIDNQ
jgi:ubiquitin carboxyl-terminal hydrolase 25/28